MSDYPFVFKWRIAGRHGQRCAVIGRTIHGLRIQFEDGWITSTSVGAVGEP
jgi:hypothetical protein